MIRALGGLLVSWTRMQLLISEVIRMSGRMAHIQILVAFSRGLRSRSAFPVSYSIWMAYLIAAQILAYGP